MSRGDRWPIGAIDVIRSTSYRTPSPSGSDATASGDDGIERSEPRRALIDRGGEPASWRRLVVGIVAASLAACTASAPVVGQMQRGDETFSGVVSGSGYSGGSGDLTLVSNRSVTCKGPFTYTSRRRGEGVLSCDDGRTGPFFLSAAGSTGTGHGELSGQRFTFTFGAR